jgi:cytochrome P450
VYWVDVDLTDSSLYRTGVPYELFGALRDEHAVWRHPTVPTSRSPEGIGFWVVLGHPEVQTVSRDWRTYSSIEGLAVTPTAHYLEYLDHVGPILEQPLQIKDGQAVMNTTPGTGITWDERAVSACE